MAYFSAFPLSQSTSRWVSEIFASTLEKSNRKLLHVVRHPHLERIEKVTGIT